MLKSVFVIVLFLLTTTCYPQKSWFILTQLNSGNHFFVIADHKISNLFLPIDCIAADTIPKTEKKDDAFSRLMAGVVNDTAILYNSYVDIVPKKDTVKREAVKKPVLKTDNTVAVSNKKDSVKKEDAKKADTTIALIPPKKYNPDTVKNNPLVINKPEKKKDSVQRPQQTVFAEKLFEEKTDSSLQLMYASVNNDGKRDTVYMSIPLEKIGINKAQTDTLNKVAETVIAKKDSVRELPKDTALALIKLEEKTTLQIATTKVADSIKKDTAVAEVMKPAEKINDQSLAFNKTADSIKKDTAAVEKKTPAKIFVGNTNCKNLATDYDVDKLRVKMMAAENEDDKIFTARKFFRVKCFSTNQVKALSEVFSTDEGRYKLFDTAYPFVSDYGNYPQLSTLLTSQYYINRFSAMIKQ